MHGVTVWCQTSLPGIIPLHLYAVLAGVDDILDLKAYLGKYAYSIVIDVLAANTFGGGANPNEQEYSTSRDRALFSLLFQRSATFSPYEKPNRVMWQVRQGAVCTMLSTASLCNQCYAHCKG